VLSGWTLERALAQDAGEIELSITHSRTLAAAVASIAPR
jgi:hypothetical protein